MKWRYKILLLFVLIFFGACVKKVCYKTSWDVDPNEQYTKQRNKWPAANGVALDAETGKPIVGAQVKVVGSFRGFMGGGGSVMRHYTKTDEQGRYQLTEISYFGFVSYAMYEQFIYKAGYILYSSGHPFQYAPKQQEFKFKDNVVLLGKWDENKIPPKEHVDHVNWIDCNYDSSDFCKEAREELILGCLDLGSKRPRSREI